MQESEGAVRERREEPRGAGEASGKVRQVDYGRD